MSANGKTDEKAEPYLRILVTGGCGFLGSHLCRRLVAEGHDVVAVDNFFTSQKSNVKDLLGKPNFELVRHDISKEFFIEVDQIYNMACPASPVHYQYDPVQTTKTSVHGAINMLGLAKRVRARILLTSTSEIYGDPEVHPQPESYWGHVNPIGPRSCYDEGKRVAETMMYAYKSQENVEVRVARIFNTFGPRMHPNDGRVVSNFIIQSLQGKPITIYGEGTQTRSFQFVDDLVNGLMKLMNGKYDGPVNTHMNRHGGASADFYLGVRSIPDIKARGHWGCDASVARCKKVGAKLSLRWGNTCVRPQHGICVVRMD